MPKSKKKRFNLLYFLIFGFMLYFCFHVYFVVNAATIKTYTLDLGEISNTIEKDVLILREEYQLKAPSAGYVSYFVDEGDRVKRADLIAKIQNEELSGDEQSTLQILNRRINELKNNAAIQNPEKEIEEINNKIDFLYTDISHRIAENDISYIPALKEQILTLMDRKKLLTGASSLGNMTVEQLEAKKAEIQNKLSSEKFYIKSINPGVLAFYSDGLQDEFSIINKDKLSVTKINKFQDKNLVSESESVNQGDVIASIINNHMWYLATEVTPEDIKVIERGKAVEIIIDKETIKAKLEDFYKGEDEKFVGLFSIEDENFDFTKKRKYKAQICYENPSGLLIPKETVTNYENKKGVFIVNEVGSAVFKPIDTIAGENEKYYVLRYDPNALQNSENINLYDELIVSPKNIKDGQRVR